MSSTYTAIYSSSERIRNRVSQLDAGFNPMLYTYQIYVDTKIDNTLKSVLGTYDKNKFLIQLPLTGSYDTINIQKMIVTLHMDAEIQMAADDLVIALFRKDTAENEDKSKIAEENLLDVIYTKYGCAISIDQDFTTDYLSSNKLLFEDGTVLSLEDGSGVALLDESAGPTFNNPNNPDSRVIFVPTSSPLP